MQVKVVNNIISYSRKKKKRDVGYRVKKTSLCKVERINTLPALSTSCMPGTAERVSRVLSQ